MATTLFSSSGTATKGETPFDFSVKDIDGKDIDLSKYRGKVILVVNVASQCGKTIALDQVLENRIATKAEAVSHYCVNFHLCLCFAFRCAVTCERCYGISLLQALLHSIRSWVSCMTNTPARASLSWVSNTPV